MPEQMTAAFGSADIGGPDVFGHKMAERVGFEGMAIAAKEKRVFVDRWHEQRPDCIEVFFDPLQGATANRNNAVFSALPFPHPEDPLLVFRSEMVSRAISARRMAVE